MISTPIPIAPSKLPYTDLNNDGNQDIILFNSDTPSFLVLHGLGNGSFSIGIQYSLSTPPIDLIARDFNGDGKMDLAVFNENKSYIYLLNGSGNGSFTVEKRASNVSNIDLFSVTKWNNIPTIFVGNSTFQEMWSMRYSCPQ